MNRFIIPFLVLIASCNAKSRSPEQSISKTQVWDTTLLVSETNYTDRFKSIDYKFIVDGDTIDTSFSLDGNDSLGYYARFYNDNQVDFNQQLVFLERLVKRWKGEEQKINGIKVGRLIKIWPYVLEVTKAYEHKNGRDVSTHLYKDLEFIIFRSGFINRLDRKLNPLNIQISEVDVEKVFFTTVRGVEVLDAMVWLKVDSVENVSVN